MSKFSVKKINRDFLLQSIVKSNPDCSNSQLSSPKSNTKSVITTISVENATKTVVPEITKKCPELSGGTQVSLKCIESTISKKDKKDGVVYKAVPIEYVNDGLNTFTETDNEEKWEFNGSEDDDALSLFAGSDFEDDLEPESPTEQTKQPVSSHSREENATNIAVISESPGTSGKINKITFSSDQNISAKKDSLPKKKMKKQSVMYSHNAESSIANAILEANVFSEPIVLTNAIVKSLIKSKPKAVHQKVHTNGLLNCKKNYLDDYDINSQPEIKRKTVSNLPPSSHYLKSDPSRFNEHPSRKMIKFVKASSSFISEGKDLPKISSNRFCPLMSIPTKQLIPRQNLISTDRKRKSDSDYVDLNMNKPYRLSGVAVPSASIGENRANMTSSSWNDIPKEDTDLRIMLFKKNNANRPEYGVTNEFPPQQGVTNEFPPHHGVNNEFSTFIDITNPSPLLFNKELPKQSSNSIGFFSSKYSVPTTSTQTSITQSQLEAQRQSNPFASTCFRTPLLSIDPSEAIQTTSNPFLSSSSSSMSVTSTRYTPMSGGFQSISGGFQFEMLESSTSFNNGLSPSSTPLANKLSSEANIKLCTNMIRESALLTHSVSNDIDWPGKIDIAVTQRRYEDCVTIARDAYTRTELGTHLKRPFGENELSDLVHKLAHEYSAFESAVLAGCIETYPSLRVLTTLVAIVEKFHFQLVNNEELIKTLFVQFCKVLYKEMSSEHSITVMDKFIFAFSTLGQWKRIWSVLVQSHVKLISGRSFILISKPLLQSDDLFEPEQAWFKTAVRLATAYTESNVKNSQPLAQNIAQLWIRCIDLKLSGFLKILGGFPDKPLLPQVQRKLLDKLDGLVVQCIVGGEYEKLISLIEAGSGLLDDLLDVFVKGFSLLGENVASEFETFLHQVYTLNDSEYFHFMCAFLKDLGFVMMKHLSDVYAWQQVQLIYIRLTQGVLALCPSHRKFNAEDACFLSIEADLKLQNFDKVYQHVEDVWCKLDKFSDSNNLYRIVNILKELLDYYLHLNQDLDKAEKLFWLLIQCLTESNVEHELIGLQTYYNSLVEICANSFRRNNFAHSIINKAMSTELPKGCGLVLKAYPLRLLIVSSIRMQDAELSSLLSLLDRGQKALIYEKETLSPDYTLLYIPTDAAIEEIQLILYGMALNLRKRLVELAGSPSAGDMLGLCRVKVLPKDVGQRDPNFLTFTESISNCEELLQRVQRAMRHPTILKLPLHPCPDGESILLDAMDIYTCIYETFNA